MPMRAAICAAVILWTLVSAVDAQLRIRLRGQKPAGGSGTILFSEDFQSLNPLGGSSDFLHFDSKWGNSNQACTFENVGFGTGACPTQPYWGYSLVSDAGPEGAGDHVVEVWHARAVDQVNIGWFVDIANSPSIETSGEVYWGFKYKVITADAFAVWDNDTSAGMNKFIEFGVADDSRVINSVTNNQDNYDYLLGGLCAGVTPALCTPSAWSISASPNHFNATAINNKYGGIGAGWGVAAEGVGPGLIGVDGLTGVPSGGWICFQFYAKAGGPTSWELRLWRAAIGQTLTFASPTIRHVGGDGTEDVRSLGSTNWNGTWYLGGFVGEPIVDYHYQIDDFWIGTGFRADACTTGAP
jgi:hypothetical protein